MAHSRGRSRGFARISESQKRKKTWLSFTNYSEDIWGTSIAPNSIGAPGSSLVVAATLSENGLPESTLLRIRGWIHVPRSDLAQDNADATDVFAFGIGFVTDEAAQLAAVPNPATAEGASWDGWMFLRTHLEVAANDETYVDTEFDVKAQRKWMSGQSLIFVAGFSTDKIAGLSGEDFSIQARGLFLLP